MKIEEITKKAKSLGIKDAAKLAASKKSLIRAIQRKEGNFECFGSAQSYCDQSSCCWKVDCFKIK
ncbi:MAG: SAP domain-containing protein [Candidatus Omnitrophota bacterium]